MKMLVGAFKVSNFFFMVWKKKFFLFCCFRDKRGFLFLFYVFSSLGFFSFVYREGWYKFLGGRNEMLIRLFGLS